jgi:hypothetical protein
MRKRGNTRDLTKELSSLEDPEKIFEELDQKEKRCKAKGHHPFSQEVLIYHSDSRVLARCTGCWKVYERAPTPQEKKEYADATNMEYLHSNK